MEGFNVVLGTLLGFLLGLVGSEVKTSSERVRRRSDLAESLYAEISSNREAIKQDIKRVEKAIQEKKVVRHGGPRLPRDVVSGCVGDLALLPTNVRIVVLRFYRYLIDMESVVGPGHSWPQASRHTQEETNRILDEYSQKQRVQIEFLQRAKSALKAAHEAVAELEKLTETRKRWWQRILGR